MSATAVTRAGLRSPSGVAVITVLGALVVGSQLPRLPALSTDALYAVPVVLVAGIFLRLHPRWSVVAIVSVSLLGFYRNSVEVGPIDLRLLDLPFAVLALWAVVSRSRGRPAPHRSVGQQQLGVLLLVLGASLVPVLLRSTDSFVSGTVSWARFAQTMALVWLVPYAIRTTRDRDLLVDAISLVGTLSVGHALLEFVRHYGFNPAYRLDGVLGPNATGLVAGLLIVFALLDTRQRRLARRVMGTVGVAGLILSQSVGAIVAVGLTLGIYGLRAVRRDSRREALIRPARALLLVGLVLALVSVVKPVNLPTSRYFERSSTAHRTILGLAGLEIFVRNPVLGVGWQRSSLPEVIGDPTISNELRERFTDANEVFFPDVTASSVHNAYIQILAEAGLPGLLALGFLMVTVVRRLRRIAANPGPDAARVRALMVAFVVVVLWWNDNALFGAQPETVLAAMLLGMVASVPSVVTPGDEDGGQGPETVPAGESGLTPAQGRAPGP